MGEMADYHLDQVQDMEDLRFKWRLGEMSTEEGIECGVLNEQGGYETAGHKKPVTCRCCKTKNLHWEQLDNKWRLFDYKGLHHCPVNPLK